MPNRCGDGAWVPGKENDPVWNQLAAPAVSFAYRRST